MYKKYHSTERDSKLTELDRYTLSLTSKYYTVCGQELYFTSHALVMAGRLKLMH